MGLYKNKKQDKKSQSSFSHVTQKKSNRQSTFQFKDNRPEAVFQMKLQNAFDEGPQVKKAAQLQSKFDSYTLQKKENNTGLPDNLKSGIENLSGHSMDDVKVHYNSEKPAQLNAYAYAQGANIHIASGQEKHLPHEAWHVVQQKQGRVQPTTQLKSEIPINDDDGLEKEADEMGAKAIEPNLFEDASKPLQQKQSTSLIAQLGRTKQNDQKQNSSPKKKKKKGKRGDTDDEVDAHDDDGKKGTQQKGGKKKKDRRKDDSESRTGESDVKWNPEDYSEPQLIKIAEAFIEKNIEKKNLTKRVDLLKKHPGASEIITLLKKDLAKIAKTGDKLPLDASETEAQDIENAKAESLIESIQSHDPDATKKYRLSPASHEVDRTQSAGARLAEKNKKTPNWTQDVITSIQNDENPLVDLANKSPLFYGTTDGQRMHVLGSRFLKGKNLEEVEHKELQSEVTKKLGPGEKETWPEVSNFWLDNPGGVGVGLAGERQKGMEVRPKGEYEPLSGDDLLAIYKDSEELLQKIIDLKTDGGEPNARNMFLAQFRKEQAALQKDWLQDVERPDYSHKPGSKGSDQKEKILQYEDLICRRMCKWMLHVATYHNQAVIYSLDEIDLDSVAEAKTLEIKDTVSGGDMKLKVPVCTSELREIFRSMDRMTSDDPTQGVKFFKELQPVDAPWEKTKIEGEEDDQTKLKSWAEYALHLTKKMLIKYPGDTILTAAGEEMVLSCLEGDYRNIIQVYKEMKPSELQSQSSMTSKPDQRSHEERLNSHSTNLKNTEHLQNALEVINNLEGCILGLNDKTRSDLKGSSKSTSKGKTSSSSSKDTDLSSVENELTSTMSNPQQTGIKNLGQTCYLASGLNMLAYNFKDLFVVAVTDSPLIQNLKTTISTVLNKITNGEFVTEAEVRDIIKQIATLKHPSQEIDEGALIDDKSISKSMVEVASQNSEKVSKVKDTALEEDDKKPSKKPDGLDEEQKKIDNEVVQLAYRQQDVSEIIFGDLFNLLQIDTSTHSHVTETTKSKDTGDGATDNQVALPEGKSLEEYSAFPQTNQAIDFKIELPISEVDNLDDALEAFKNPQEVIPDVKNVQGGHLHESSARETRSFMQDLAPPTLTIVLKRFAYTEDQGVQKIGKDVNMPKTIAFGGFVYELSTVVFHHGTYRRGHYTTSAKEGDGGWKNHDDSTVSNHDNFDQDKDKGYIYVYKKTDEEVGGDDGDITAL